MSSAPGTRMQVQVCPHCNARVSPDARFCDNCGVSFRTRSKILFVGAVIAALIVVTAVAAYLVITRPKASEVTRTTRATLTVESFRLNVVSVPPGSRVMLDGKDAGTTDVADGKLTLTGVSKGQHSLVIQHEGLPDWTQEVSVDGEKEIQAELGVATVAPTLGTGRRFWHFRCEPPSCAFVNEGSTRAFYLHINNCEGGCAAYVNGVRVTATPPGKDSNWVNVTNRLVVGLNTFRLEIRRGLHGTSYGLQLARRPDLHADFQVCSESCGLAGRNGCGQETAVLTKTVQIW